MNHSLPITSRHPKALSPSGLRPEQAPEWIDAIDNPYLHGLFAPTISEITVTDLEVEGEIPRDLNGAYFRNGPNNRFAPTNRYHWFDGDGMVHGIWFEDGHARYRNRWIDTKGSLLEQERGAGIWPGVLGPFDFDLPHGPLKDTANTDLLSLRGKLAALWYESGQLYTLDPNTLESVGVEDFNGALKRTISAHSKTCPQTGDFVYFGYRDRPPYMWYGVARADGSFHQTDITIPGPRRPHDIGITENYSVLHDFPVFFDPDFFARTGKRVPLFHRDVPTRYGVIPRFGTDQDVRWFEFDPCYMLHVVNCWEEGDWVVMTGCRTDDPTLRPDREDGRLAAMLSGLKLQANLYEWRMNLHTGESSERKVDDLNAEFPMIAAGWTGRKNRFSYHQIIPWEIPATFHGINKYNLETGTSTQYHYGEGVYGSESPFAPRDGSVGEDDGYLLSFVTDVSDWSSACIILDASDVAAGPLATIKIPHRMPAGFHATWMGAHELG